MNLNRFVNIVVNVLVRRLANFAINGALGYARRTGRSGAPDAAAGQATRETRALARRARRAARIARRFGR